LQRLLQGVLKIYTPLFSTTQTGTIAHHDDNNAKYNNKCYAEN